MKKKIIYFTVCTFCLLLTQANAVVTTQDCEKYTKDVMITIKSKVNLNEEQYSLLNNIITKSCINDIVKANNKTKENDDWFTEKILSGDTKKKEGNIRLKKLK